jgi:hypothetical protein
MKLKFNATSLNYNGYNAFNVLNRKKEKLGLIWYESKWKEWVWEQCPEMIMSVDCLNQVIGKLEELNRIGQLYK